MQADNFASVHDLASLALKEGWDETRPPNVTMAQYLPDRTGTFSHFGPIAHLAVGRPDELKDCIVMRGHVRPPGQRTTWRN
jgi:hypothetical protein